LQPGSALGQRVEIESETQANLTPIMAPDAIDRLIAQLLPEWKQLSSYEALFARLN